MKHYEASIQTLRFLQGKLSEHSVLYQEIESSICCMEKMDEIGEVIIKRNKLTPSGGWEISDSEAIEAVEAIYIYGKKEPKK